MIEITGTGGRPGDAMKAADAVARSLVTFANASTKETGVRLVSLAGAAEPDGPASPSAQLDTAVGGAAGLLVGALVMMTRRRGEPVDGTVDGTPAEIPEVAPSTPRPRSENDTAQAEEPPVAAEPAAPKKTAAPKKAAARSGTGAGADTKTAREPHETGSRR
jgi:hypothetical protein